MAVTDAAEVRTPPLLPLPSFIEPHTPLTAYSSYIATLHLLSRKSVSRTALLVELSATSSHCADPLSSLYPLLLHSFARLQSPAVVEDGERQSAQQLWTAVRNIVTVRATQSAFIQSAAIPRLLDCLSVLCTTSAAASDAGLLLSGCQLLANTTVNNADTQSAFLHYYLLSSHFLAIVRSCPFSCLSSLLYILHTALPSAAEQSAAVDSPGGAALLAELTLRLSRHQLQHAQHDADADEDEDEDEADVDSGLLFPSLVHRLFVHHGSFVLLVSEHLQLHHPNEWRSAMTFLLSSLLTLSACSLEVEAAAYCASGNCLSVLSMLLARYSTQLSERVEDDEGQYRKLPLSLPVDAWTHSGVLLVEHVLSSCLALAPSTTPPLSLLQRLFAVDVWYMLISLLASSTAANGPSQAASSSSLRSSSSTPPSRPPTPFGFQSDLLRLLALLCSYPSSQPPPYVRLTSLSFLAHTTIDGEQPMQREYSVVGIRGLCRWEEARRTLASMEVQAVDGQDEWRQQGVQLELDQQSHKVRLASAKERQHEDRELVTETDQPHPERVEQGHDEADMWSVERMAAVRNAGRRVDWGESADEPFTEDDFM